jgi:hypothetical protein
MAIGIILDTLETAEKSFSIHGNPSSRKSLAVLKRTRVANWQ